MRKSIGWTTIVNVTIMLAILLLAMNVAGAAVHVMTVFEREKAEADHNLKFVLSRIDFEELSRIFSETKELYRETAEEYTDEEMNLGMEKQSGRFESFAALASPIMDESYEKIRKIMSDLRESADDYNFAFVFCDAERSRLVYVIDGNTEELRRLPGQWESAQYGHMCDIYRIYGVLGSNWYMPVQNTVASGWTASDFNILRDPDGREIGFSLAEMKIGELVDQIWQYLLINIPILGFLIFGIALMFSRFFRVTLIDPIVEIAKATDAFIEMDKEELMEGRRVFAALKEGKKTPEELFTLIQGMRVMENGVAKSLADIRSMAQEKERIEAELSFASQIQKAMLPSLTPEFTQGNGFSLYAFMRPAKAVGGDFYDFFFLDSKRLAFLVADVSDKGMGAALFMAISKSVIRTRAFGGGSASEILKDADSILSEGNGEGMFVTVFFAILDLETGEVAACNAGHDYPMVCFAKEKGSYVLRKEAHGAPLGFLPGMEFPEVHWQLSPGDRIFLYTDGVNEAQGKDGELFDTERMIEVLDAKRSGDDETVCRSMKEAVDGFVKDDPQFDDMTMLSITWQGRTAV